MFVGFYVPELQLHGVIRNLETFREDHKHWKKSEQNYAVQVIWNVRKTVKSEYFWAELANTSLKVYFLQCLVYPSAAFFRVLDGDDNDDDKEDDDGFHVGDAKKNEIRTKGRSIIFIILVQVQSSVTSLTGLKTIRSQSCLETRQLIPLSNSVHA